MRSYKMSDSKDYIEVDDSIFDEIDEYFDRLVEKADKEKKKLED